MKTATLFTIVASAAAASAQVTQLPNGTFQCAVANANFCADSSLGGPIIIRCDANKVGQPGNCGDNLAGEPPVGVGGALCFQTSPTSGDASCEKNCVVFASSGPSTLPSSVCKPSFTASSSTTKATSTTSVASSSSSKPTTTTASANSTSSTSTLVKTTITTVVTKSSSVTAPATLSTGTGSGITTTVSTNGTLSNGGGNGGNGGSGSATNTPVGPTSTKAITTVPTAGAATNGISVLALAGLVAAYML